MSVGLWLYYNRLFHFFKRSKIQFCAKKSHLLESVAFLDTFWVLSKSKRLRTAIHCPQSFIIKSYFLNIFLYHGSDSVVSVVVVEELLLEAMGVV